MIEKTEQKEARKQTQNKPTLSLQILNERVRALEKQLESIQRQLKSLEVNLSRIDRFLSL